MESGSLILYITGFALFGYLSGSLPFSIWVTRLVKGVDVRDAGSRHATTTNTIRQAGFGPGAVVLFFDIAKGTLPTWLALRTGQALFGPEGALWLAPLTAAAAVVGHCWPVFAGFRGGMGLATTGGCLLAAAPFGFLIGLGLLIALVLLLKHSARASVATGILIAPAMWLIGQPLTVVLIAAAVGLVIALRFLIDWNRQYRELWLDREPPPHS